MEGYLASALCGPCVVKVTRRKKTSQWCAVEDALGSIGVLVCYYGHSYIVGCLASALCVPCVAMAWTLGRRRQANGVIVLAKDSLGDMGMLVCYNGHSYMEGCLASALCGPCEGTKEEEL